MLEPNGGHPFGSPFLIFVDGLRCYTVLLAIVVVVGMAAQVLHPQPSLGRHLQMARALFITGSGAVLLGNITGNIARFGFPPTSLPALICWAIGVTVLLVSLRFESKARKAGGR